MTEPTQIIMIGAAGRMGRMILECAADSDEPYQIVAAVESERHPLIGHELNVLIPSAPDGVSLTPGLPPSVPAGAVAIIFSLPAPTLAHMEVCARAGIPVVIGTTGFSEEELERVVAHSSRIPVILSPNMSVGVNVLCELVARAVELLGPEYDIEITEMHHRHKKDAPSGTARRLAEVALAVRGQDYATHTQHGREGISGDRPRAQLGMHALRGGDVVGDHTVTLAGPGERIELTHRAHTRATFARGALRAARWLRGRKPGMYGMKDVLGL